MSERWAGLRWDSVGGRGMDGCMDGTDLKNNMLRVGVVGAAAADGRREDGARLMMVWLWGWKKAEY